MNAWSTALRLNFFQPGFQLWMLTVYVLVSPFLLIEKQIALFLFLLGTHSAHQGRFLNQSLGLQLAFVLPRHQQLQLYKTLIFGLAISIPPAVTWAWTAKLNILYTLVVIHALYTLTLAAGYVRRGELVSIVFFVLLGLHLLNIKLPEYYYEQAFMAVFLVALIVIICIPLGLIHSMRRRELLAEAEQDGTIRQFWRGDITTVRKGVGFNLFGGKYDHIQSVCNRWMLEKLPRSWGLQRVLAVYGGEATLTPLITLALTLAWIALFVAVAAFSEAGTEVALIMLFPLILFAGPYLNELAESRSRIARFWFYDNARNRKHFMRRVAGLQCLRLLIPAGLWALVFSAGWLLFPVEADWLRLYSVLPALVFINAAFVFGLGLLNKHYNNLTRTIFLLVYLGVLIYSLVTAWFAPPKILILTIVFALVACGTMYFWSQQNIEQS